MAVPMERSQFIDVIISMAIVTRAFRGREDEISWVVKACKEKNVFFGEENENNPVVKLVLNTNKDASMRSDLDHLLYSKMQEAAFEYYKAEMAKGE